MNKHQLIGATKGALGAAQQPAGKSLGSTSQKAKGLAKKAEVRMQEAYGNLKEALKNSRHS
ncbi:MAG: CsbD family protein [Ramlibacter sp.]